MRILIVAMSNSVHTARWISQIDDQGWDIHLFPSYDVGELHPDLTNLTAYLGIYDKYVKSHPLVKYRGVNVYSSWIAWFLRGVRNRLFPNYRAKQLANIINQTKPDIVHSLEMQGAGALVYTSKKWVKGKMPPWIITTWGSDIYYFGRFEDHARQIKQLLAECNYFHCECTRDIGLARKMGLSGVALPVLPDSGGFDLLEIAKYRQKGPTSRRKLIMIKGYHGWAGRALIALQALEECVDIVKDYEVIVYSAQPPVIDAVAEMKQRLRQLSINLLPPGSTHETMLRHFGRARIAIGLSITDGISTMVLEAMAMGAFPIQSNTSCANEWIKDDLTGILVPPEDVNAVTKAIRKALTNDVLVDEAANLNAKTTRDRLDEKKIKPEMIKLYQSVIANSKGQK